MKSLRIALFLLISLAAGSAGSATPKPLAVWFYADWCMNCKIIAPKIAQVQPEFDQKVDFVKLDVTSDQTKVATRAKAKELGILPLYMSNHATGWLALIDTQGKQVGELKQEMSVDDMRAALSKLTGDAPVTAAPPPG